MSRPSMILRTVFGACALLATSACHGATTPIPTQAYDADIDALARQAGLNGVALVRRDGQAVHAQGYGLAELAPARANTVDTPFRIASVSKAFTATLAVHFVEQGLLDLHAPVSETLPAFDAAFAGDLTLHHLLSHTSGIPHYPAFPGWLSGYALEDLSQQDMLNLIADQNLVAPPGSQRHYSSANYYLAGLMIEAATGQRFAETMQERILSPLGLNDSGAHRVNQHPMGLAAGYRRVDTLDEACPTAPLCPAGEVNLALFIGTGAMYATASDLANFVEALVEGRILSAPSRDMLLQSYGWSSGEMMSPSGEPLRIITADGALEGYSALLVHLPSEGLSIVLLDNTGLDYGALAQLALEIVALEIDAAD